MTRCTNLDNSKGHRDRTFLQQKIVKLVTVEIDAAFRSVSVVPIKSMGWLLLLSF